MPLIPALRHIWHVQVTAGYGVCVWTPPLHPIHLDTCALDDVLMAFA
jgi:hypothetical protein